MHDNHAPTRSNTGPDGGRELRRVPHPVGRRQHGDTRRPGYYAESSRRPLRRRAATMARPARVRMRSRKPCVLARRRLFGWKVRLLTIGLHHSQRSTCAICDDWGDRAGAIWSHIRRYRRHSGGTPKLARTGQPNTVRSRTGLGQTSQQCELSRLKLAQQEPWQRHAGLPCPQASDAVRFLDRCHQTISGRESPDQPSTVPRGSAPGMVRMLRTHAVEKSVDAVPVGRVCSSA